MDASNFFKGKAVGISVETAISGITVLEPSSNRRVVANGFSIEIHCTHCGTLVSIPYRPTAKLPWIATCSGCHKQFGIDSSTIARQIKLFAALCQQLKASEEILANAFIAVTVGSTEVKIPFRLLLTRLKSTLDLDIDGTKVSVSSRTEPLKIGEAFGTVQE